jgi:hypothetical protein
MKVGIDDIFGDTCERWRAEKAFADNTAFEALLSSTNDSVFGEINTFVNTLRRLCVRFVLTRGDCVAYRERAQKAANNCKESMKRC